MIGIHFIEGWYWKLGLTIAISFLTAFLLVKTWNLPVKFNWKEDWGILLSFMVLIAWPVSFVVLYMCGR